MVQQLEAAVRGNNPCFPVSRLVSIENTHAQCGGKVLSLDYLDALADIAQVGCFSMGGFQPCDWSSPCRVVLTGKVVACQLLRTGFEAVSHGEL